MNVKTWMKWMGGAVAAVSVAMTGCGHDEAHDAETELCEHLQGGASRAVTATAEAEGAPGIADDHTRYEVSLPEVNGQREGHVTFAVDHGGEYLFGLSRDVPVELRPAAGGDAVALTKSTPDVCEELAAVHSAELGVGTYVLRFGPTGEQAVDVVVEHHHGEDHAH